MRLTAHWTGASGPPVSAASTHGRHAAGSPSSLACAAPLPGETCPRLRLRVRPILFAVQFFCGYPGRPWRASTRVQTGTARGKHVVLQQPAGLFPTAAAYAHVARAADDAKQVRGAPSTHEPPRALRASFLAAARCVGARAHVRCRKITRRRVSRAAAGAPAATTRSTASTARAGSTDSRGCGAAGTSVRAPAIRSGDRGTHVRRAGRPRGFA